MSKKKTVIIGATPNTSRYAYLAAQKLTNNDHPIVPLGIKSGEVFGQEILDIRTNPQIEDVDTITLYLNPQNQESWQDYILGLNPTRIIFNPGTENPDFMRRASESGIQTVNACTLVMLSAGTY